MVPLFRPYLGNEELEEIKTVLDSKWLTQGPKVKEFETLISKKLGVKHVIATSSCTTALHLAILGIGIENNGGYKEEVLVADYTFPATGHAVVHSGANPIFVDVNPRTYNLDIDDAKRKITQDTRAIIPVHTFGQVAEMDAIMEFAIDNNISVIEDAACAFGSKYKSRMAGTIGDVGCFSFHATKGITTGEGGCVVTNNDDIAERIQSLSMFGTAKNAAWERDKNDSFLIPIFDSIGYNYKMSDISAAIGVAQIRKLDRIIRRKRELASYYDKKLKSIPNIRQPYVESYNFHNYQGYCTLVDPDINRNRVIQALKERGIGSQIGTYSSFIQPAYKINNADDSCYCPVSLDIYNTALRLPLYYELTTGEIDIVCEELKIILTKG